MQVNGVFVEKKGGKGRKRERVDLKKKKKIGQTEAMQCGAVGTSLDWCSGPLQELHCGLPWTPGLMHLSNEE